MVWTIPGRRRAMRRAMRTGGIFDLVRHCRRAASFAVVGGGVALLGLVLLYGLVDLGHVQQNLAYLAQAIVSIELSFILNGRYTWRDRTATGVGCLVRRWAAFHTTKVFTILINQVLFATLLMAHLPYLAAYLFCVILCT